MSSSSVQSPVGSQRPFGPGMCPIQPVMYSRRLSATGLRLFRHPLPVGELGLPCGRLTGSPRTPSGLPRSAIVGDTADLGVPSAAWALGIRNRSIRSAGFLAALRGGLSLPKQSRCHPLSGAIPNATSSRDSCSSPCQPHPRPDFPLVTGYWSLGFILSFTPHRCRRRV